MSLYCDVADVTTLAQVLYQQVGFTSNALYTAWISGTLIPMAMRAIENYVGHNFYLNHGTIRVDGSGKRTQLVVSSVKTVYSNQAVTGSGDPAPTEILPLPLITVTGVTIDGTAQTIADIEEYKSYVASETIVFNSGRSNVDIIGTWGYGTYPPDIRYVTAQVSANILTEMIRKRMMPDIITPVIERGDVSERVVSLLTRSPYVLTKAEKNILDNYKYHYLEVK